MSNTPKKSPIAELKQAEGSFLLQMIESTDTVDCAGTTVMERFLERHRAARDAAIARIRAARGQVEDMAADVVEEFNLAAGALRGGVADNEAELPALPAPEPRAVQADVPALPAPRDGTTVPEATAQSRAVAPRKPRGSKKPRTDPAALPAPSSEPATSPPSGE